MQLPSISAKSSYFLSFIRLGVRLVWLLCLLSGGQSFSQSPIFRNLTVNDGLAGNRVYTVFEDSKGYIWFGTETGVTRFDGKTFTNYTSEDGLSDTEVMRIHEDSQGRIWFFCFANHPCFFKDGKIYNSTNTSYLEKLDTDPFFVSFHESEDGSVWLGSWAEGMFRLMPDGEVLRTDAAYNAFHARQFYATAGNPGEVIVVSGRAVLVLDNSMKVKKTILDFEKTARKDAKEKIPFLVIGTRFSENSVLISWSGSLAIINTQTYEIDTLMSKVPGMETNAISALRDDRDNIWIGCFDRLLRFRNGKISQENLSTYYEGQQISKVRQDREGSLWISTQANGVFFIPSPDANLLLPAESDLVSYSSRLIRSPDNKVFFGFDKGRIYSYDGEAFEMVETIHSKGRNRILDMMIDHLGNLWCFGDNGLLLVNDKGTKYVLKKGKSICQDAEGNFYFGGSNNVHMFPREKMERYINGTLPKDSAQIFFNNPDTTLLNREVLIISDMVAHPEKGVYVGCMKGLVYLPHVKETVDLSEKHPELRGRVARLASDDKGRLWVGFHGKGLVCYDPAMDTLRKFTSQSDGLAGNVVTSVFCEQGGDVFVSTYLGLSVISETEDKGWVVRSYSISDGLPTNEIQDVTVLGEYLILSSQKGIVKLDRERIFRLSVAPKVYLVSFQAGDSIWEYPEGDSLVVPWNSNSIAIRMIGISPRSFGSVNYRYRLEGADEEWHDTEAERLEFPKLPSGSYVLEMMASNKHGVWTDHPLRLKFTILTPYWRTLGFRAMVFILLGVLVAITAIYFVKRAKIREREKAAIQKKIVESELKALQAQMNPHFIFNSLNSIQRFIFNNDKESAYHYLERFGTLIRRILENSKTQFVTLEEEIETLEIYLELESLRFDKKFQYKIDLNPGFSPWGVRIPPMLIQPYVENAIWHGLMPREEPGRVEIKIDKQEGFLVIVVEDDGIGREQSRAIKRGYKRNRVSTGLAVTAERLRILSDGRIAGFDVQIEDLYHENGDAAGTRVILKLPFKH